MLICSSTPNGCLGELLVNKGRSHIGLFICFANGLSNKNNLWRSYNIYTCTYPSAMIIEIELLCTTIISNIKI